MFSTPESNRRPQKRGFVEFEPQEKSVRNIKVHRQRSPRTVIPAYNAANYVGSKINDINEYLDPHQGLELCRHAVACTPCMLSALETREPRTVLITPSTSAIDLSKTSEEVTVSKSFKKIVSVDNCEALSARSGRSQPVFMTEINSETCTLPIHASIVKLRQSYPSKAQPRITSMSVHLSRLSHLKHLKSALVAVISILLMFNLRSSSSGFHAIVDPNSVYVTGGGFSGFWFSIGRLQSIPNPSSKTYYCYSAGCLAVVAALSNSTLDQMTDLCFSVQRRWQQGETKYHKVVTDFLNNFLSQPNVKNLLKNDDLLARIHVITAVKKGWFGLKSTIRSPSGSEDLYSMLLQTTWIPFATGETLWEMHGSPDGEYHMDGIFSSHDHPPCAHHVGLPWNWDLRINALNVNLGASKVAKFWNQGLDYGL